MKKILVFGSLNIDIVYSLEHIVRPGETLLSSNIEKNAGGKGLNQACAIAKTGLDVYMAGCVGEDGDMLLETFPGAGHGISFMEDEVRYGRIIDKAIALMEERSRHD